MPAKQYVKGHAVSLGLIFVFLAASAYVAWYSMKTQPPREIGFELPMPKQNVEGNDETWAELRLTGVKLDAAKKRMTGEAEISLVPNELSEESKPGFSISREQLDKSMVTRAALRKAETTIIFFSHAEPDVRDARWNRYVDLGGTDKPIQMSKYEKNPSLMTGKGPFTWTAEPLTDSFWYPFDSYRLYVNPQIVVPMPDRDGAVEDVTAVFEHFNTYADKMSVEFAGANLVPELKATQHDDSLREDSSDPFEIDLYRPFLARAYTVFVIVLMAFGLVYLYFFKDIEGSAGDLLGFFVAALGTRTILLAGVDFSPVLLDYVVVFFSILATGVVFGRWIDKRLQPDNSIPCPHCTSRISPAATRCPHCAGSVTAKDAFH